VRTSPAARLGRLPSSPMSDLRHAARRARSQRGLTSPRRYGRILTVSRPCTHISRSPRKGRNRYSAHIPYRRDRSPRESMQSRKNGGGTARLQARRIWISILLRTTFQSGHGIGTAVAEQIRGRGDVIDPLAQLGIKLRTFKCRRQRARSSPQRNKPGPLAPDK